MKKSYPLKACPWCKKTGSFHMDCTSETWTPHVKCKTFDCPVKPASKFVPIRKSQRLDAQKIQEKVERSIKYWNDGDLFFNNEGFELDFDKVVEDYKAGVLGLPKHRSGS